MFLHHRGAKTVITGTSGSGKTTFAVSYIRNAFRTHYPLVFCYDWQGEFMLRFPEVQPVDRIADLPAAVERGFVLFDPSVEFPGDACTGLQFFARWAFELSQLNIPSPRLFCCDEIQLLTGTHAMLWEMQCVLETGRRWALDLCLVAQQLNQLHNAFINQATELVSFQHTAPYILEILEENGFDPEAIQALQNPGGFISKDCLKSRFHTGKLNV